MPDLGERRGCCRHVGAESALQEQTSQVAESEAQMFPAGCKDTKGPLTVTTTTRAIKPLRTRQQPPSDHSSERQPGPLGINEALEHHEEKYKGVNRQPAPQHPVGNIIYEAASLPILLGRILQYGTRSGKAAPGVGGSGVRNTAPALPRSCQALGCFVWAHSPWF